MTGENIKRNVREERERGDECLRAAEHLIAGGFFNDAVSRSYYAALHYARALLFTKELEAKSHRGVNTLFSLHFVKGGQLSFEALSDLSRLETFRELSDYNSSTEFTREQAMDEVDRARRFIAACLPLLVQSA
jgi:uncharacterized protein (UPF0332 family)